MKTKKLLMLLILQGAVGFGSSLEVASSTLDLTGFSTTSTSFEDAQQVAVNTSGDVLVLGSLTCSANRSVDGGYGRWRLSSGTQVSKYIERSLSSSADNGSLSVVHVFTNLTAETSVSLQQQVSRGRQTITTRGLNLISIPLTTSNGEILNYGIGQQDSATQTSSKDYADTGLSTTVSVDCVNGNGIYMAASFNSSAVEGPEDGVWMLRYRKVGDAQWISTGSEIRRSMSTVGGYGAITLYALEENLTNGTYEVALDAKSVGGAPIQTLNGTLVALSLSYTNATGEEYFDGFSMVTNDLVSQTEIQLAEEFGLDPCLSVNASSDIVATMSIKGYAGDMVGEFGHDGTFGLVVDYSTKNQESERYFENMSDYGSIASVAHFSNLSNGTHTLTGYMSDDVYADNVTLVGFVTESAPVPADEPMAIDTDADALPDSWEIEYFGETANTEPETLAANELNTLQEAYIAGIDPTDPAAVFGLDHLTTTTEAGTTLEWQGVKGRVYTVYWTDSLMNDFTVLQSNIPWDETVFTDTAHQSESGGFYKIGVALDI